METVRDLMKLLGYMQYYMVLVMHKVRKYVVGVVTSRRKVPYSNCADNYTHLYSSVYV